MIPPAVSAFWSFLYPRNTVINRNNGTNGRLATAYNFSNICD
jgi:hypothetical protein